MMIIAEYDKHAEKKQGGVLMIFEKLRTCGAENKFRSRTGRMDCKYRSIRKR